MSARSRLAIVDDLLAAAADLRIGPADDAYEPGVEQLATLLEALVQAQYATAEALVEADERRVAASASEESAAAISAARRRARTRHQVADE